MHSLTSSTAARRFTRGLAVLPLALLLGACQNAYTIQVVSPLEDGETTYHEKAFQSVKNGETYNVDLECKAPAFAQRIKVRIERDVATVTYWCAVSAPPAGGFLPASEASPPPAP